MLWKVCLCAYVGVGKLKWVCPLKSEKSFVCFLLCLPIIWHHQVLPHPATIRDLHTPPKGQAEGLLLMATPQNHWFRPLLKPLRLFNFDHNGSKLNSLSCSLYRLKKQHAAPLVPCQSVMSQQMISISWTPAVTSLEVSSHLSLNEKIAR